MTTHTRIAVLEDSAAYRRALVDSLNSRPGWRVVLECSEGSEALHSIASSDPQLVMLDLLLASGTAIDLIPRLREQLPRIPIVVLTVVDTPDLIVRALEAGASGYLLKGSTPAELIERIEDAIAGGAIMSPAVARRLVEWFHLRQQQRKQAGQALTEREWEVLNLAARGKQQGEIARSLTIAVNTVKNHFRNIYEKLGVTSLNDAIIKLKDGRSLLD